MDQSPPPASLQEVMGNLRERTAGQRRVTVGDILVAVGERSFAPITLVAGLITVTPLIGDLPGVPTILGLLVLLTLGQLLFQKKHIWLPAKLKKRNLERETLTKGLDWLEKPARFVDRITKRRLTWLVRGPGRYFVAMVCMLIAAAMPAMEVVPFSANGGGLALMTFGLAMLAEDGLLALIGTALTGGTLWLIVAGLAGG